MRRACREGWHPHEEVPGVTMTCNLCPEGKPFTVPCGDGTGEALMAQHMEDEHGESGPMRRLSASRARARRVRQ